jgi:hypothetical protein
MRRAAALVLLMLLVACASPADPDAGSSPSPTNEPIELWPLPDDPMALAREAGLKPETTEKLEYHVHAHLDVFKDGEPVLVPGGIGIDTSDPAVKDFGGGDYGLSEECADPCISPLHTHGPDGVLHTESATREPNTFGQFLIEWDVELPSGTKVYVDGDEYTRDVHDIELSDGKEIAVVIGSPPSEIPSEFTGEG